MNARTIWRRIVEQLAGVHYTGPAAWPEALTHHIRASDASPVDEMGELHAAEARHAA